MTAIAIILLLVCLIIAFASNQGLFHTLAYNVAVGQTANTDSTAQSDDIVPISNSHFLPYENYQMIAAYTGSATMTRSRINSGTIRQVNPTYIRPISVSTLPPNNPNFWPLWDNPYSIVAHEEIAIEVTSGLAMGTEQAVTILWWSKGYEGAPQGREYILRWTASTTLNVRAWTTITYTLETSLPAGKYTVVMLDAQSTNLIAARMIFDNQVYRPGILGLTSLGNRNPYNMIKGLYQRWGDFYTYSLPRIQLYANAGDTSEEGYIHVVKVG